MTLLRLDDVQLAFGPHVILDRVQLTLDKGERLALVGRNGAGKSTLMSLMEGHQQPDSGTLWCAPGLKIGTLSQQLPPAEGRTLFDVVAEGLPALGALLEQYDQLIAAPDPDMNALARLHAQIEAVDGWSYHQRIRNTLERMGLPENLLMEGLSGGWRRRVALARALVSSPDLLLLDEPTNHLDLDTILWLEEQLKQFPGAVVFVTHDRAFLEHIATGILALDRGQLSRYPGSYNAYQHRKAHELDTEAREQALFDKKLAQEEAWIRQGIKARRTRNEGRVRQLQALRRERADRRERQGSVNLSVDTGERSGKTVAKAVNVSQRFEGRDDYVVRHFSAEVQRGDRIGLIGRNGAGKTTLLKILLGQLTPSEGQVTLDTKLQVAYFDQLRAGLDMDATVFDNVALGRDHITVGGRTRHVMSYLQDFLFAPDRARQPVKALSGGEANRLMLAKLFTQPANVLVLDEPTNDLDIETLELLEELLLEFDGTLLLVSHDRAFMDNVVTSVLAFEGEGRVVNYVGGYTDWIRQGGTLPPLMQQAHAQAPREALKASNADGEQVENVSAGGLTRDDSEHTPGAQQKNAAAKPQRKLSYKLKRELEQLPEKIEEIEKAIAKLEAQVSQSGFYEQGSGIVQETLGALTERQHALEAALERWVELEALQEER